jgi:hypothetical protein
MPPFLFDAVGWVEPTGPAFGRPDDKLRDTHRSQLMPPMGFAKSSTHPGLTNNTRRAPAAVAWRRAAVQPLVQQRPRPR